MYDVDVVENVAPAVVAISDEVAFAGGYGVVEESFVSAALMVHLEPDIDIDFVVIKPA